MTRKRVRLIPDEVGFARFKCGIIGAAASPLPVPAIRFRVEVGVTCPYLALPVHEELAELEVSASCFRNLALENLAFMRPPCRNPSAPAEHW